MRPARAFLHLATALVLVKAAVSGGPWLIVAVVVVLVSGLVERTVRVGRRPSLSRSGRFAVLTTAAIVVAVLFSPLTVGRSQGHGLLERFNPRSPISDSGAGERPSLAVARLVRAIGDLFGLGDGPEQVSPETVGAVPTAPPPPEDPDNPWLWLLIALLALMILALLAGLAWWLWQRRSGQGDGGGPMGTLIQRLERAGSAVGIKRRPSQGVLTYSSQLRDTTADQRFDPAGVSISEHIYRANDQGPINSPGQADTANVILQDLEDNPPPRPPRPQRRRRWPGRFR